MEISYKNRDVQRICNEAGYAVRLFPKKICNNLQELMYKLSATQKFEVFRQNPANEKYRIHELQGDKKGIISLSLDYSYRMTVTVEFKYEQDKIIILGVTKHYGD